MEAASSTQLSRRSMSSWRAARISAPILIDSGYRRGTDIVKALALGANVVLLGRATVYGLALAGEAGVDNVVR